MFSSFRNRFGIPGVISVIALVFAMFGGAYAASDNRGGSGSDATASAKAKKGPKGPKGPKGAKGDIGPAGAQGPAGPKGDKGDSGSNGADGAAGKSVVVSETAAGCAEGGVTVKVEGSSGGSEVCNGEQGIEGPRGDPWTVGGTLPDGATQTGVWAFSASEAAGVGAEKVVKAPISFNIPLDFTLDFMTGKTIYVPASELACDEKSEPDRTACHTTLDQNCPGNVAAPKAKAEYLCIYKNTEANVEMPHFVLPDDSVYIPVNVIGGAGVVLNFKALGDEAEASGSFAVSAKPAS